MRENTVSIDLNRQLIELLPRLRRFACGLAGSSDRGDELVQLACERLLKHYERLRPDSHLDSWLYQVIRNLHIDGIRSESARTRNVQQLRMVSEIQTRGGDDPENQLRLYEVDAAMQRLSVDHRTVLMLVCVEGLSYREAANVLEVPIGTVTSRLIRARKALLQSMAEDVDGSNDRGEAE